jgi:ubiquinone/menaquinone biosynthesis C-methylase UbiE
MEIENQEKVWDSIAKEWHEYKKIPSQKSMEFLSKCSGKVLDLGSGSGRHLTKIKKGRMWLVDFSTEMLKLAKKKAKEKDIDAEFVQTDMTNLPFENEFFDYGICVSALHCISGKKNRKKAIKELYRVMKPNSEVYVGVWNEHSKRFIRKTKKGKKEHLIGWTDKGQRYYYLFSEEEIHSLFRDVGFKIVSEHNSEMMINFIAKKKI